MTEDVLDCFRLVWENRGVTIRLRNILLIIVILGGTGAHWCALQSVAWTTMIAENLRTVSLTEAIVRTFDGRHPCSICKVITNAKKSGKRSEFLQPPIKLEFPPAIASLLLVTPSRFHVVALIDTPLQSLSNRPITPPPRAFCA